MLNSARERGVEIDGFAQRAELGDEADWLSTLHESRDQGGVAVLSFGQSRRQLPAMNDLPKRAANTVAEHGRGNVDVAGEQVEQSLLGIEHASDHGAIVPRGLHDSLTGAERLDEVWTGSGPKLGH